MFRRSTSVILAGCLSTSQLLRCVAAGDPYHSKIAAAPPGEASRMLGAHFKKLAAEADHVDGESSNSDASLKNAFKDSRTMESAASSEHLSFADAAAALDATKVEPLRKRLHYQSKYRGMAELDMVLGAFADAELPAATPTELLEFDAVLRELDTDLFHWLITVPGRKRSAAAGDAVPSHTRQTAQSIQAGTSDYADCDKKATATTAAVAGAAPTVDDEFVEPKEMLESEWHRRDDLPEKLKVNSMFKKLAVFCEEGRSSIVKFR